MATKKKEKKAAALPQTIYISRRNEGDPEDEYFSVDEVMEKQVEDDGPTLVGTYQLVESHVVTKQIVKHAVSTQTARGV